MNQYQPIYNDQAYIAESFLLNEDFILQSSRLACFKINSYKLSLIKASFCKSREDLEENLKKGLLNFTTPVEVLNETAFFSEEIDN